MTRIGFAAILALACIPTASAQPCPAPLSVVEPELDSDYETTYYAYGRLALCGWDAAQADFQHLLARRGREGSMDAHLAASIAHMLLLPPRDVATGAYDPQARDAPAWMRAIQVPAAEVERAAQRVDAAEPALVELLQRDPSPDGTAVALGDLALAWRDVHHGDLAAAEQRLAQVRMPPPKPGYASGIHVDPDLVATLRAALRDEPAPGAISPTQWTVRPVARRCFDGVPIAGLDPVLWRVAGVVQRRGPDAALRVLLEQDWPLLIEGRPWHRELATRLRARYTPAELRHAWDTAEAALHGDAATLTLFGATLPLPDAEECTPAARPGCAADPGSGTHPIDAARRRELVRATALYRDLFDAGTAARADAE